MGIPVSKKRSSFFRSLKSEKATLEEKIERLSQEKENICKEIEQAKTAKIVENLKQEKEELEERIERLQQEKDDVLLNIGTEEIISELKCPKDYRCYNKKRIRKTLQGRVCRQFKSTPLHGRNAGGVCFFPDHQRHQLLPVSPAQFYCRKA